MKTLVDEKHMKMELNRQKAYEVKVDPVKAALVKFVSYRANSYINLLRHENLLGMSLQRRLFRATYYYIEKAILSKRMSKLGRGHPIINCALCEEVIADKICPDCGDEPICNNCTEVHFENVLTRRHRINNIDLKPRTDPDETQVELDTYSIWQKFEKFFFILDSRNEFYVYLRLYFVFMKESYLTTNNISNQPDLAKFILDQRFSMFGTENQDKILKFFGEEQEKLNFTDKQGVNLFELDQLQQSVKKTTIWGQQTGLRGGASMSSSFHGKQVFNDEEMLFLNRAALLLFSEHGSRLSFDQFVKVIKIIQEGDYAEKVELVVRMMKEGRQDQNFLLVDHIIDFFMASMP